MTGGRARVDVNGEERVYLSAETAERVNQVAKALGLRVQFADSVRGGTANAQISGDTILIEKDNPNPVLAIAGHEFGHRLQELAPEEYRRFRESILEGREQEVRDKAAQYAKQGVNVTYEEAMNEVANDQAGLLMDGGEVLDRFIEQHRSDRTLLQKMRDAIRSFIDKVTGKERKRLETAEGKLEAALKAAAREAKALQKKSAGDTMGAEKYSLKEDENNGIIEENHRATQISGNYRDSGYDAQQKTADTGRSGQNRQGVGSEVRSEVGSTVRREDFLREHRERGDRSVRLKGDYLYAYHEATPLYAVGGKKAAEQYAKFRIWMEGIKNETDGNRTSFDRWNGSIQSAPWNQRTNLSDTGRRETVSGHDSLYAGASEGNRGGTPGTGAENRRVNSKFFLKAPVEETRDLVAASAPTEYAESGRWQSAVEQAKFLQDKAASDTIGSDYWSGGKAEYSYGNLYQAARNGDSASVETIRKALEASGKDPKSVDSAVKSRLRADLKEAFWDSESLNDSQVRELSRLLAQWDPEADPEDYLEKTVKKKWKEAYQGGKGEYSEYRKYYDILKKTFGYSNDEIIRMGKDK